MSIINIIIFWAKPKTAENSKFRISAILIFKGVYLTLYLQMFSCMYIYV